MIFNNNTTSLGGNIPMAEGYDCSYGTALALVESARNDYAMFRAMLNVESRELQIRNESAGYVTEGEIMALTEATLGGIWNKIKELFSKLIAKIKAIFHTFLSKIDSLYKTDSQMVKKYKTEILRKGSIGNLEVKWRKVKESPLKTIQGDKLTIGDTDNLVVLDDLFKSSTTLTTSQQDHAVNNYWAEDSDDRFNKIFGMSEDSIEDDLMEGYFDDDSPSTYQIKDNEVGGIRGIITYLENFEKLNKSVNKHVSKITQKLTKLVNSCDKNANIKAKNSNDKVSTDENGNKITIKGQYSEDDVDKANKVYEISVTYQNGYLKIIGVVLEAIKIEYKQNKAAFMKAIAANNEKLKNESTLLGAFAEAVEDEVEDVIDGAISSVDISNTNNASTDLLDGSVSNDPDKLVYADDPDYDEAKTDGTVDSKYTSNESAFFAAPLY